ncbi:hypothetical protein KC19_10G045800 [Ceratodon purpureus]|uniref:Uncharacterized protein n=1 Tax=Ceratodon purpureus TaxID=3225 RepID=A0A8T0GJB4_CERPU|nr:hypothetical protein KC19_10G045800 [Ceratodon purpureus]
MAQMDSWPATDLALHPSPVLTEAVLKVEQVVARLQNLQTTISGLHLSPVNSKYTSPSRTNATNRVLNSRQHPTVKDGAGLSRHRDEYKRNFLKDYKARSKVEPEQMLKSKAGWNQWLTPTNQVHDVISEILIASEFAKQIATLVAKAIHNGPQKIQKPAEQAQDPKGRVCKDGKRKDIAFPSKAQLQKTMCAKAPQSKSTNKFKVAFTTDAIVKLVPAANVSRPKGPPIKSGLASSSKRRISRGYWSNSSSPDSLSPRSPRVIRLFNSPESSFRDSGDVDDELSFPKRPSTNVTEIMGPAKPWKLTPTKGVLFSNPVYSCSPTRASAPRPSPVKITSTSARRRSLLLNQRPLSPEPVQRESLTKRRSNASANPLTSSISKVTLKRDGITKAVPTSDFAVRSTKREQRVRKSIAETVPQKCPTTQSEVLKVKPVRTSRRLMPLDANSALTDRHAVMDRNNDTAKDLRCRDSHSHAKSSPHVENMAAQHEETSVFESFDKENAPVPSCAPAVMFCGACGSLFRRAKGWMSSQAIRPGRGLELER